jgi:hypothetical protein
MNSSGCIMKVAPLVAIVFLYTTFSFSSEKTDVSFRVVADRRLLVRDAADKSSCVWTALPEEIDPLLRKYGLSNTEDVILKKGEVLALFLNDRVEENLIEIKRDGNKDDYIAHYADSGMRIRFDRDSRDRKLTHVTAVVLHPPSFPKELVLRGTGGNGGSDKG